MKTASESHSRGQGTFKYELLLLLVSMIWGSAFVAQQIGMEKGLGPMTFNGLRFALGCLFPDPRHPLAEKVSGACRGRG
jgi:drug/metabolite transporter (DMT)-like permease